MSGVGGIHREGPVQAGGHDGGVGLDSAVEGIQRRDNRLRLTGRPDRNVSEGGEGNHRQIERVRQGIGGNTARTRHRVEIATDAGSEIGPAKGPVCIARVGDPARCQGNETESLGRACVDHGAIDGATVRRSSAGHGHRIQQRRPRIRRHVHRHSNCRIACPGCQHIAARTIVGRRPRTGPPCSRHRDECEARRQILGHCHDSRAWTNRGPIADYHRVSCALLTLCEIATVRLRNAEAAGKRARLNGEHGGGPARIRGEARQGDAGVAGSARVSRSCVAQVDGGSSRRRGVVDGVGGVSNVDSELENFRCVRVGVHHFPHSAGRSVTDGEFDDRYVTVVRTAVGGRHAREDAGAAGVAVGGRLATDEQRVAGTRGHCADCRQPE